jgi:hypothetical protein
VSIGGDLPQKFRPGGENSGVHLRRKFWPGGGISGPPKIFISENSGHKFQPFTAGCTTAWRKGLSEIFEGRKFWNFWPPKILDTQNFRPLSASCTTPCCKGLSQIFQAEFLAPLLNVAPQLFVKDLAEFRRAGNSGIFGPRKFCPGAWKQISGLEIDTPLDDFEPFYSSHLSHFSSPSVLCNTWRIPAMLSTRLIFLCCNQTPKNWKLGTCPFTLHITSHCFFFIDNQINNCAKFWMLRAQA